MLSEMACARLRKSRFGRDPLRSKQKAAIVDTMMMDGLEDAYTPGTPMDAFAQDRAEDYQFTRAMQDAHSERAREAISTGMFAAEIVGVEVKTRYGPVVFNVG
ncbi:hypothetical protein [Sphingobium sp. B2]|uniref:thiolase family protein n=1 Tax=Sphingobium sp. B2 TaxID=2583228 RepID=UPI0021BD8204|nr:hypothetical protein [Sphingobium sp. B2]